MTERPEDEQQEVRGQAILLADQTRGPLDGLGGDLPPALLPVLDKPLVVWAVEELASAGFDHVVVAVSDGAHHVEAELGNGDRFGLTLQYQPTRGDATPRDVARRAGCDARLAADATVLRHDALQDFLRLTARAPERSAEGRVGDHAAGLTWLGTTADAPEVLTLRGCALPTTGIEQFHAAHLAVAAGALGSRPTPGHVERDELRLRDHVSLHPGARIEGPTFIGRHCQLEAGVQLTDGVVLAGQVVVGEGAQLRRCVVLPGSYIGPHLTVENALVAGSTLVRLDMTEPVRIDDPTLLAPLDGPLVSVGAPLKRALAALALVLSLPLWPVALLDGMRGADGRPALRRRRVRGFQKGPRVGPPPETTLWETASTIPVLRRLPGLLDVLAGRIDLVGVRPRATTEAAPEESWESAAAAAPPGLIGPALVDAPADGSEEDRLMAEALYAGTRSLSQDLSILWRALPQLFAPRAWRRRPEWRADAKHGTTLAS